MPQPKKRHSNSRQGKRRFSNYRVKGKTPGRCTSCGAAVAPHRVCPECGSYKGKVVKPKKEKKAKKEQE